MTNRLKQFQSVDPNSFLAEGESFLYSYSAHSGELFVTTKNGQHHTAIKPPYEGIEAAKEFADTFEKSAQIKALRMTGNQTVDIMSLVGYEGTRHPGIPMRDVDLMFDQVNKLARMTQMIERNDMMQFAQELANGHALSGIDIYDDEEGNKCFSCATILRTQEDGVHASGADIREMIENVSQELYTIQRTSAEFMRVTYPPLIEGPAGMLETIATSLNTSDPALARNAGLSQGRTLTTPLSLTGGSEGGRYRLGG